MEFVKEFAIFLYESKAIKFGDFTLASSKKSSYYIDLRIVPSFPIQFRKTIKALESQIIRDIGLENFDSLVSVPTGGLVMASALAIEIVKPLVYVRTSLKDYGTSKAIEGYYKKNTKMLMIDDVATTGGSMLKAITRLKEEGLQISDAYVLVNRMQGADKALGDLDVKMHHLIDILEIVDILFKEKMITSDILEKVKTQVG